MRKVIVQIGSKFGKWTVIDNAPNCPKWNRARLVCKCECGTIRTVASKSLRNGISTSCGCFKKYKTTHGMSSHPLFRVWNGMKSRCRLKSHPRYGDYGGRGIDVCDEWMNDFMSFFNWAVRAGYHSGLTVERTDNNGNYDPSNCVLATRSQQMQNTRRNRLVEYHGRIAPLACWCRELGLSYGTVSQRINKLHWCASKALETPIRKLSRVGRN